MEYSVPELALLTEDSIVFRLKCKVPNTTRRTNNRDILTKVVDQVRS